MRLHTDYLTEEDIREAAQNIAPGVGIAVLTHHTSRSRDHAFEVRLRGNCATTYGHDYASATYDEWGTFMTRLYEIDPNAVWGPSEKNAIYRDAPHFHDRTMYRFENWWLPEDAHYRHRWEYVSPYLFQCKKCSARLWNGV